jgi:hypothetical protein
MKIDNNVNIGKLNPSSQQNPAEAVDDLKKDGASKAGVGGDTSQVSSLAKQIAEARAAVDGLPDVRAEKMALARQRLASGFYDTPEAKEVLVDKLASLIRETSSK